MDPLLVLPKEVVLHLCSLLAPEDLVSLGQLNHSWRYLCRDPEVWKRVELVPSECGLRHAARVLRSAPRLGSVQVDVAELAEELLRTSAKITRIDFFNYEDDLKTMKQIITRFAGSLEVLELGSVSPDLIDYLVDTSLPKLRELSMFGSGNEDLDEYSEPQFCGGRWADHGPSHSTLQTLTLLSMDGKTADSVRSLITAHRYTLKRLELGYGDLGVEMLGAVAMCGGLTHLSLFWNRHLGVLEGKLPALRFLELEYLILEDEVDPDLLPASLITRVKELTLVITQVDLDLIARATQALQSDDDHIELMVLTVEHKEPGLDPLALLLLSAVSKLDSYFRQKTAFERTMRRRRMVKIERVE